jgi:hypothetical protein
MSTRRDVMPFETVAVLPIIPAVPTALIDLSNSAPAA